MKRTEKQSARAFVQQWQRTGAALEDVRIQELSRYSYKKNATIIDGLLTIGCEFGSPRCTSGLVELQRWLAKSKR